MSRPRYRRCATPARTGATAGAIDHRYGSRTPILIGTFGKAAIAVARTRPATTDGETLEWQSQMLRRHQPRTLAGRLFALVMISFTNRARRG